jgi:hypothetical protein
LPVAVASCGLLPVVVVVACAVACAVERDKYSSKIGRRGEEVN